MDSKITRPTAAWALLLTVHRVLVDTMEARLAQAGLPPLTWYDILWTLECAPGGKLRMSELAKRVLLARPNLTRLSAILIEKGLIARERTVDDGRGAYAVVTAAGLNMRKQMWSVYYSAIEELFLQHLDADLEPKLQETFRAVLKNARTLQGEKAASEK